MVAFGRPLRADRGHLSAGGSRHRRAGRRRRCGSRRPTWCPRDANLLDAYGSFAELETACEAFCERGQRPAASGHPPGPGRDARRGAARLHRLPAPPFTATFGVTRTVGENTPMVTFEHGQYSVPHRLAGETVWVRRHGEQVVIVHVGADGPVEVARHQITTPGNPRVDDAHFPPAPEGALDRSPRPTTAAEAEFLAIGDGAALWLTEAAAQRARPGCGPRWPTRSSWPGCRGSAAVDRALGQAAVSRAASPRATWPRSSPTRPPPARPATGPARTTPCPGHRRMGRVRRHQASQAGDTGRRTERPDRQFGR